jgi:hypothetical protein
MWKPALFLVTIIMVTPGGRGAVSEYLDRASSQFAFHSLYAEMALIALVLVAVGAILLMFCQSPRNTETAWVVRRVYEETASPRVPKRGRRALSFFRA